ncbi:MAG: GAF domain-containing protein [Bacteroidota bacterium]
MSDHREEKALREFKQTLADLLSLIQGSSLAQTAWVCWVNHNRQQFVVEASQTRRADVMFPDRIPFQESFLQEYKNLTDPVRIEVGADPNTDQLHHHPAPSDLAEIWIIPFINNGETVALTILEFTEPADRARLEPEIASYTRAFGGILHTWLELMDLHRDQHGWTDYDEQVQELSPRMHRAELLTATAEKMQTLLPTGGITLITKGTGVWMTSFNTSIGEGVPLLGTVLDEKSLAYDALQSGSPTFSIHFNQSPRRVAASEEGTEGATLAIPLMLNDHRQAVVLAYDRNPLAFTESLKHKLINLVRVAGLSMQAWLEREDLGNDQFASRNSSILPDLWERTLDRELDRSEEGVHTWFGLLSIDNIQEIRTAYRLESLNRMQLLLVGSLAPHRFGKNGIIGFHSDYVYAFLLQDRDPDAIDSWLQSVEMMVQDQVRISAEESVQLHLKAGYTSLGTNRGRDRHRIVQDVKQALSEATRSGTMAIEAGMAGSRTIGQRV